MVCVLGELNVDGMDGSKKERENIKVSEGEDSEVGAAETEG